MSDAIDLSSVRGVRLHADDHVAIATAATAPGAVLEVDGVTVDVRDDVPRGHKVALVDIPAGTPVRRYGEVIGFAAADVRAGDHIHVHNLEYREFEHGSSPVGTVAAIEPPPEAERDTFEGYLRADGTVGTRNYLGVLTSVNCSATAAKQVAARVRYSGVLDDAPEIDGVVALTHGLGCGMAAHGEGIDVLRRVMRGYLRHPNFVGFLILGLGCEDNQITALTDGLQFRSDLAVQSQTIQGLGGTKRTVEYGVDCLTEMLPDAARTRRTTLPVSRLVLGTNCGGSDAFSGVTANPALGRAVDRLAAQGGTAVLGETPEIYGAEHLLLRRATSEAVIDRLLERLEWWRGYTEANGGSMDNNPSPGNKAGGLTTILEKSLGAVAKGGTGPLAEVVQYGETVHGPGLVFMDTPGYDPVSVTGIVAGGANVVCFTTGRGSAFGCAPVPSIKIASNTSLSQHMHGDMDINAGGIVDGSHSVDQVGDEIYDAIRAVASGTQTKSEAQGYGEEEFSPWHLGTVM